MKLLICVLFVVVVAVASAYPAAEEARVAPAQQTVAVVDDTNTLVRRKRHGFGKFGGFGGYPGGFGGYGGYPGGFGGGYGGYPGGFGGYGGYPGGFGGGFGGASASASSSSFGGGFGGGYPFYG